MCDHTAVKLNRRQGKKEAKTAQALLDRDKTVRSGMHGPLKDCDMMTSLKPCRTKMKRVTRCRETEKLRGDWDREQGTHSI